MNITRSSTHVINRYAKLAAVKSLQLVSFKQAEVKNEPRARGKFKERFK